MGSVVVKRGRPKKGQPNSWNDDLPVELIFHLRDGGMCDYFAISRASGFSVTKIADVLNSHVPLKIKIRCNKCGGSITSVPCVSCTQTVEFPNYKEPSFLEDTYEERLKLVNRLWAIGMREPARLAAASGLMSIQIDDLIKRKKLVRSDEE